LKAYPPERDWANLSPIFCIVDAESILVDIECVDSESSGLEHGCIQAFRLGLQQASILMERA
jgi:hypothetical protein